MAACATRVMAWIPELPPQAISEDETRLDPTIATDDDLVELAKVADADAFAQLMDRYRRFCLSKAYSILRNRGDAEDEVQNAWVQAWTHLRSYEGHGAFSAWLSRIVSNQCLMRLRKTRLMPSMSVDRVVESEGSYRLDLIDQRALPEDIVGDDEVWHVLTSEIRGLPPLLREVLTMRDLSEVDMVDIAALLEISVPAVKSRLMRGRLELRRRLAKHHGKNGSGTLLQKPLRKRVAYAQAS